MAPTAACANEITRRDADAADENLALVAQPPQQPPQQPSTDQQQHLCSSPVCRCDEISSRLRGGKRSTTGDDDQDLAPTCDRQQQNVPSSSSEDRESFSSKTPESGDFVADCAELQNADAKKRINSGPMMSDEQNGDDEDQLVDYRRPFSCGKSTQQSEANQTRAAATVNNAPQEEQQMQNVAVAVDEPTTTMASTTTTTMNEQERNQIEEEENLSPRTSSSSAAAASSHSNSRQPDRASPSGVGNNCCPNNNNNEISDYSEEQRRQESSEMRPKSEEDERRRLLLLLLSPPRREDEIASNNNNNNNNGTTALAGGDVCAQQVDTLTSLIRDIDRVKSQLNESLCRTSLFKSEQQIRAEVEKMVQNCEISDTAINLQKPPPPHHTFCSSSPSDTTSSSSSASSSSSSGSSISDDHERDSPANNPIKLDTNEQEQQQQSSILIMLQHLTRRRDELRLIDRQLSELMTDCLSQLKEQQGTGSGTAKAVPHYHCDANNLFHWSNGQAEEFNLPDYSQFNAINQTTNQQAMDLTTLSNNPLKRQFSETNSEQQQQKRATSNSVNIKKMRFLGGAGTPPKQGEEEEQIKHSSLVMANNACQPTTIERKFDPMLLENQSDFNINLSNNQLATQTKQVKFFDANEQQTMNENHHESNYFHQQRVNMSPINNNPTLQQQLQPIIKRVRPLGFNPIVDAQQQQQFQLQALDYIRQHLIGGGGDSNPTTTSSGLFVENPMNLGHPMNHHQQFTYNINACDQKQQQQQQQPVTLLNTQQNFSNEPHQRQPTRPGSATTYAFQQQQQTTTSPTFTDTNKLIVNTNQTDHRHHNAQRGGLAPLAMVQKMSFRCHVCGSGFEDRHRLQQHLSIHLNLNPSWFEEKTIKETMAQYELRRGDYLCQDCQFRFDTTAEFDKHMQMHGEKPHQCELCRQDNKLVSFRFFRQLLTHLRSHCFLYSCKFNSECKQTANRKDYLKLHILKHHLNNKLPEQYTICCH